MRKWNIKGNYIVGGVSVGLLSLLIMALLLPTVGTESYATSEDEFTSNVHTDIKSYVRSTIALAITGQVNLDLTPKANGTFSAETAKLSVSTNNVSGYSVYLAMVDGSSNSLLPMNTRSEEEIKATPETMTAENYTSYLNTWGYMVGGSAGYKAVPTAASTPIITESSSTKEASYDLSFAVAVGTDLPAGIYGNQVLVSTVANPIEVRGINDITYMQEMTSDICTVSFENETKQLIDTRDGKSYWVAKLKDGNCWMTQNLALDIALDDEGNAAALAENGSKTTLDESNSSMKSKWGSNNENVIAPVATYLGLQSSAGESKTESWNLGKYVFNQPATLKECSSQSGVDPLASCESSGLINVSNWSAYDTEVVTVINEQNKIYDAHYLVGNYYTFGAMTAGTNSSYTANICPKGWKLPIATKTINNYPGQDGNFYKLLVAYGFPSSGEEYTTDTWNNPYINQSKGQPEKIFKAPVYFVRGGRVTKLLLNAGNNAYYKAGNNLNNTYNADFRSSGTASIYPYFAGMHSEGTHVRCLAK